jgi:type I restriction enzyme S subunit
MNTKQLRQKILDLAIRGKLVPQDPNDEPASVLLERVRAEKERLIKEGKIKRDKKDSTIIRGDDKSHYEQLPAGWAVVSIESLFSVVGGGTPSTKKTEYWGDGIPWFSSADIDIDGNISTRRCVTQCGIKNSATNVVQKGNIVVVTRVGLGKVAVLEQDMCFSQDNQALIPKYPELIFNRYLFYFLFNIMQSLKHSGRGTTISGITKKQLTDICLLLPPLAEQYRIVVAIESSFSVIDEIERNKSDLQSVATVTKSKILSLAIRGKLVPQDPNDEPASVLLERIRTEREALIKAGKIKREKTPATIIRSDDNSYYRRYNSKLLRIEDDLLGDVPFSWEVCCLSQLSVVHSAKPYQILQSEIIEKGSIPVISQSAEFIEGYSNNKERFFAITNPIIVFGDHTKCVKYVDFSFIVGADGTKLIEPNPQVVYPKYFYYMIMFTAEKMINKGYSRHWQYLEKSVLLLPPLAEQHRIVVTIETTFKQLDNITATLK